MSTAAPDVDAGRILEVLEDVGGAGSFDEIRYQLRHRGIAWTDTELVDALYALEDLGLVTTTHWTRTAP